MLTILIDNVVSEADEEGYVYGETVDGRTARASYHSCIAEHCNTIMRENTKIVTSGHLYVFKYNPETLDRTRALTFAEFKEGKPL